MNVVARLNALAGIRTNRTPGHGPSGSGDEPGPAQPPSKVLPWNRSMAA